MRYFVAYKATGEDLTKLKKIMKTICSSLEKLGGKYYCTILEKGFDRKTKKEIVEHAFNEINRSDALLVFIKSEDKSECLLMKVGYRLAIKEKIVFVIKSSVQNTYIRNVADIIIEFNTLELPKKMGILK